MSSSASYDSYDSDRSYDSNRSRANNLNAIRFLLAFSVLLGHMVGFFIPAMEGDLWIAPFRVIGFVAVECFFVISGFLIFQSWDRSTSLKSFALRRGLRILPAYLAVVLGCAFGGALLTSVSMHEYFGSEWVKYLLANLTFTNFLHGTLPGVFESANTHQVNGALWTLKIELMFYASVPVFALLLRRRPIIAIPAIYLLAVIFKLSFEQLAAASGMGMLETLSRQLPGQMSYFVCGYAIYRYLNEFKRHSHLMLVAAIAGLAVDFGLGFALLRPAALAVMTMYVAFVVPHLGDMPRLGDMSYGIYIFHMPILHILMGQFGFESNLRISAALSIMTVLSVAFLSWHWLEKPCMTLSRSKQPTPRTKCTADPVLSNSSA
ncbi:MAG: peptidoglycan/LPS O-acetylase OafA/YrhL [Pirellulaceae bacterium]|jgi:peptidoglycan/LPS O-acetylase OafA/YrhL